MKRSTMYAAGIATIAFTAALVASQWDAWVVAPQLREGFLASAKDPSSAQFQNEVIYKKHICGEANLRNEYGGYVGYKRFISTKTAYSSDGDGKMSIDSDEPSTQDVIEELDWMNGEMKAANKAYQAMAAQGIELPKLGKVPSDEAKHARRFNRLWSRHCEP